MDFIVLSLSIEIPLFMTLIVVAFSVVCALVSSCVYFFFLFFFFKQKKVYEMRISDWSSDGCSSDLRFAVRDSKLPFDQIDAGDCLRHWMFDLKTRVHLHEPSAIGGEPIADVCNEFNSASAYIVDSFRGANSGCAYGLPCRVIRSEEHTSELQSLMLLSYAVFCLKTKKKKLPNSHN